VILSADELRDLAQTAWTARARVYVLWGAPNHTSEHHIETEQAEHHALDKLSDALDAFQPLLDENDSLRARVVELEKERDHERALRDETIRQLREQDREIEKLHHGHVRDAPQSCPAARQHIKELNGVLAKLDDADRAASTAEARRAMAEGRADLAERQLRDKTSLAERLSELLASSERREDTDALRLIQLTKERATAIADRDEWKRKCERAEAERDEQVEETMRVYGNRTAIERKLHEERIQAEKERDEAKHHLDGRIQWQVEAVLNLQTFRTLFDAALAMREAHEECGLNHDSFECSYCVFDKAVDQAKIEVEAGVDEFIQESIGFWGRFAAKMQKERDSALADLAACRAELDKLNHCFVCIECGRCAADEDGCCATCGRDALMLDHGRLVNRDFADNLEADVRNQAERDTAIADLAACRAELAAQVEETVRVYANRTAIERDTAEQIAKFCDDQGWDHTADLIRDGEWRPKPAPPPDATPRCDVCQWPLSASADQGCVPGNCSYRPAQPRRLR
jgi:hypothetical protein